MKRRAAIILGFLAWGAFTSCARGIDAPLAGEPSGVGGGGASMTTGFAGIPSSVGATGGGSSVAGGSGGTGGLGRGGDGNGAGGAGGIGGMGGAGSPGSGGGGVGGSGGAGGLGGGGAAGRGGAGGAGGGPCQGNAVQFDGKSTYATVPRVVQDDFTVEAWIKMSGASPTGTDFFAGNGLIYADVPFNANDFGTSILNNHFTLGIGSPDTTLQGTSDVTAGGNWVHVAATRTRSTGQIAIIVNGVSEASVMAANVASLTSPTTITLGANAADGRYYAGLIDEVRIWNVARSPAMVAATMHTRLAGTEAGLVGYWRFDESTGTTATDASPSHNNAVFTGTPVWVPSTAPITSCP